MQARWLLIPLALCGLAACSVAVHDNPPARTTVVTPEPAAPPAAVYATPGTSTTVVTRP